MQSYVAGLPVTLLIPLVDKDGNAISVDAAQFRVTDSVGNELIPLGDVPAFNGDGPTASVLIAGSFNAITDGSPRALRIVELHCSVGGSTIVLTTTYVVQVANGLIVGVNTFQTLAQAELSAFSMPNIPEWNAASEDERVNALIDAREHICQLNFSPLNGNRWWGQDSLNFVPEGTMTTNFIGRDNAIMWGGDLSFLTPAQFTSMPQPFLDKLYKAQIAEAEFILGGDPMELKRRAGITLDTIGETKQMLRTGIPLQLPVCRRALSYLGRFVAFYRMISR